MKRRGIRTSSPATRESGDPIRQTMPRHLRNRPMRGVNEQQGTKMPTRGLRGPGR